jgi:hypothetical protein
MGNTAHADAKPIDQVKELINSKLATIESVDDKEEFLNEISDFCVEEADKLFEGEEE